MDSTIHRQYLTNVPTIDRLIDANVATRLVGKSFESPNIWSISIESDLIGRSIRLARIMDAIVDR